MRATKKPRQASWFPWNGSKTWLLPALSPVLQRWPGKGRFIDPFVGGGSVSRLARQLFPSAPQVVGDANQWLVSAYAEAREAGRYRIPSNISDVEYWRSLTDADYSSMSPAKRAARFAVCLYSAWGNRWKTEMDGRLSASSAPTNPKWCSSEFLSAKVTALFREHWLRPDDVAEPGDWKNTVAGARPGDLVYIDPPYPEALGYGTQWWSFDDALDVVDWVAAHPNISVVVSNMATMRRLYERNGLSCSVVTGPAASKTRRARTEILAHNLRDLG